MNEAGDLRLSDTRLINTGKADLRRNDTRTASAGWWIVPLAVLGSLSWIALFRLVF